jgi:hypothetical protein
MKNNIYRIIEGFIIKHKINNIKNENKRIQ